MSAQRIEPPATVARKQRASRYPQPKLDAPSAEPIADGATPKRGRRATHIAKPRAAPPVVQSTPAEIVAELAALQRTRCFCIQAQSRCDRPMESFIATVMGNRNDAPEKERKAVFARAKVYRLAVEAGDEGQKDSKIQNRAALAAVQPMIRANAMARAIYDDLRKATEREMERLVTLLPVYPFAQSVRGLGARGLAILIAECCIPIGDYRTISGVWKRLGLAVINGEGQRRKTNPDLAALHAFSPRRRAQVWAVCSDSLFRAQWRGADEDKGLPARPIGPYGEIYARRRAATLQRHLDSEALLATDPMKWSKGRCHNDARRIMTKQLVIDLYCAWKNPDHRRLAA